MHRAEERGIVLGIVIITAVIFSIAALGMLTVAMNQRQRVKVFDVNRLRARYAAEAGVVWAQEQLWENKNYCGAPQPPSPINGLTVTVAVTNCGANNTHRITARVNY